MTTLDRHIARGDLVLFLLLAIPGVGGALLSAVFGLNAALGLPGEAAFNALSSTLLSLFGLMGFGFAVARLRVPPAALVPEAAVVKGVACLLMGFAVARGLPAVLLLFALADAVAAALLLWQWRQIRRPAGVSS